MSETRDLDVVVYGASGFTGQRVLETLLKMAPPGLRVGAAGRDETKLRAAVASLPPVTLLVAAADDAAALGRMASRARLVLACAGPFRLCGRPVAEACVARGCDYLDICGEPEYIERLEIELSETAERAGVFLASACAFDSIPSDLGCLFAQRQFAPPSVCTSVDAVISVIPGASGYRINAATYDSAVLGVGAAQELRALRKQAAAAAAAAPVVPTKPLGPRPPRPAEGPTWDKTLGVYTLPFPGADASVVRRTQAELARRAAEGDPTAEPPCYFGVRFSVGQSRVALAKAVACGGAFMALAGGLLGEWGRKLLMARPGLFTAGLVMRGVGPTEQQMREVETHVNLVARGYGSKEDAIAAAAAAAKAAAAGAGAAAAAAAPPQPAPQIVRRVRVSLGDLGYKGTAFIFVTAALTLLEERTALERATGKKGGVFTAGGLFRLSTLVDRLQRPPAALGTDERGVKFEVLPPLDGSPAAAAADAAAAAVPV
jgi:hypothetical protein